MGYNIQTLRNLRSQSVGTEVGLQKDRREKATDNLMASLTLSPVLEDRHSSILARYVSDMDRSIREAARVLAPGGRAVYVVGENTVRGTYIPTAEIISRIALGAGLSLEQVSARELAENKRYLPPPSRGSAALDTRMRREVVLTFSQNTS
jgi:hypothetical protein